MLNEQNNDTRSAIQSFFRRREIIINGTTSVLTGILNVEFSDKNEIFISDLNIKDLILSSPSTS